MILLDIPRRAKICTLSAEHFVPGSLYFTRLIPLKEGEYERQDYSASSWEKVKDDLQDAIIWKGEVPKKTALEKKTDKLEKGLEALRTALEGESLEEQKEALLMALFLQRRKNLIARGEIKKKGVVKLLFEVLDTEEMLAVSKVTLNSDDSRLQARIAEKL